MNSLTLYLMENVVFSLLKPNPVSELNRPSLWRHYQPFHTYSKPFLPFSELDLWLIFVNGCFSPQTLELHPTSKAATTL